MSTSPQCVGAVCRCLAWAWLCAFGSFSWSVCRPPDLAAQTTGNVIGRVTGAATGEPVAGASVTILRTGLTAVTDSMGRFVMASVPAGERTVRVERIGFRPTELEGVVVSLGRSTSITIQLDPAPVAVEGVTVEANRVRLIEPDVSATRAVVIGRELRALPIDGVTEAVELTPGVSGGHFRGGRAGQEVYIVDGLEVKNQLEASAHGPGLELPPGALDEIEVITGGITAAWGSALSGVVSFVTRRGNAERWAGSASATTDQWAPESLFRGFTALNVSAGGPVPMLPEGSTLYVDVLGQGMADSDPRARGLDCLHADDADAPVAALIERVRADAPDLYCPYTGTTIPHQRGDKLIGFTRLDAPLGEGAHLVVTALGNRLQRELYSPEFKYNPEYQLGQRSSGSMVSAGLDLNDHGGGRARHLSVRLGFLRLDRYLGALDPGTFNGRASVGGLGLGGFDFLGERFVRRPIEQQLSDPGPVPGYAEPGGYDSPFGPAGAGLFHTEGTPTIANWTRSDAFSADVVGEVLDASGALFRAGASGRLYQVESYERTLAYLAGAFPSYARFHPASVAAFVDGKLAGDDELSVSIGLRLEAFRSGVRFRANRDDFLAPELEADWHLALMPRLGVSLPLPGTDGHTALRFNYGQVAQAPDFRYFLDTTIGDSIRRAVSRQGNPQIAFERARAYELAVSHLLTPNLGVTVTAFRKELSDLATGDLQIGGSGLPQYSTNDFGTVKGIETSVHGQWRQVSVRAAWGLQKATGISSGIEADTLVAIGPDVLELPLAFDQRHAIDLSVLAGNAAGDPGSRWGVALTVNAQSGYPLDRRAAAGDTVISANAYLPWTSTTDLRLSVDLGHAGCSTCVWRVVADGRNLLGRRNVLALDPRSGQLAPDIRTVDGARAGGPALSGPIPAESPLYRRAADINSDGLITPAEFDLARLAAVLDRYDPSLRMGEPRALRIGVEVQF